MLLYGDYSDTIEAMLFDDDDTLQINDPLLTSTPNENDSNRNTTHKDKEHYSTLSMFQSENFQTDDDFLSILQELPLDHGPLPEPRTNETSTFI